MPAARSAAATGSAPATATTSATTPSPATAASTTRSTIPIAAATCAYWRCAVRNAIAIEVRFIARLVVEIRATFDGHRSRRRCMLRRTRPLFRRKLAAAHLRALLFQNRFA